MSGPFIFGRRFGRRQALWAAASAPLALHLAFSSCAANGSAGNEEARDGTGITATDGLGRIVGTVRIGPICPVERIPPAPACRPTPEMFARVKVVIRSADGETIRQADLDDEGNYSVELESGTYLVGTNRHGFGLGGREPPTRAPGARVDLAAGETERVDIDIDTGIR